MAVSYAIIVLIMGSILVLKKTYEFFSIRQIIVLKLNFEFFVAFFEYCFFIFQSIMKIFKHIEKLEEL